MSKIHFDQLAARAPLQPERLPPFGVEAAARPPLVVFDLDGTLVDTAPDLAASLNHCLSRAGIAPIGLDDVRPYAGLGARAMLEHAYALAARPLGAEELAAQTACFLAFYEAHICDRSVLFEGALDAMDALEAAGFRLAICTNKYEHLADALLVALGIRERFAAVCGADTFARRKPDPVHLLGTIEAAGGDRLRTVMIGDTRTDIDAARAVGVPSILVAFGYSIEPELVASADRVIDGFDRLSATLVRELMEDAREPAIA